MKTLTIAFILAALVANAAEWTTEQKAQAKTHASVIKKVVVDKAVAYSRLPNENPTPADIKAQRALLGAHGVAIEALAKSFTDSSVDYKKRLALISRSHAIWRADVVLEMAALLERISGE